MFIKSDVGETEFIEMARCFENYHEAVTFCSSNKLKSVELVLRTSDNYEFSIAMPDPAQAVKA